MRPAPCGPLRRAGRSTAPGAGRPSSYAPRSPGSFVSVEGDPGKPRPTTAAQLEAVRLEFEAQARRFAEARARLQAVVEQLQEGRPRHEILHNSVLARLQARLESMPVIEQAKGILMAQQRCGPDDAFDLLRRLSQRRNVKISVLAAQIVEQVSSPGAEHGAMPAGPAAPRAASRHLQRAPSPGTRP
jgi:hypothetical protein